MQQSVSSVWEKVQSTVPKTGMAAVTSVASSDTASMINNQLASALSTMGDAQYWEESISPSTVRTSLANGDPSNPTNMPALLKGMKWLLASISKGRDVSDFYSHVVKLVGATSLEVRKMVYIYLGRYADHDANTRELSLLSINSFQRGMADHEQLIRALALRVLSSIRVPDILQIQILAVQKSASDKSPYVRKCAANALSKLYGRCDSMQQEMLLEIMNNLLREDTSTMVLSSTLIAFSEICPDRLEMLHPCYRKICHLLTDMDEWGQVVVIDIMARYCRRFFRAPRGMGTAERIDRERRVRRTINGIAAAASSSYASLEALGATTDETAAESTPPNRRKVVPAKIKRRVVKQGFYSDEEDDSVEEEVYLDGSSGTPISLATAMRQKSAGSASNIAMLGVTKEDLEDSLLHEDHRLLLRSSLPLLKSRNAGVVLAVCTLHYYCGVASVKVRSSLGKALVRIHRDRREIQYVVLASIRTLAQECPSAFSPFLNDFFVTAMDPSFTRLIKLDILTSLALDPASIERVMKELRSYIRHEDTNFVCASARAVAKVVELARIVHDRHGASIGEPHRERNEANTIALNALYGLMTLTQACENDAVVGECAVVMQRILVHLLADRGDVGGLLNVEDPNKVQEQALKRLLLLLIKSLSSPPADDDENLKSSQTFDKLTEVLRITPVATAATLWIMGEWLAPLSAPFAVNDMDAKMKSKVRIEVGRLVAAAFPRMAPMEKASGVHFAAKLLVSSSSGFKAASKEAALCELILSMGRQDVQTDVRDRARQESGFIHAAIGLKHDLDAMTPVIEKSMTLESVRVMLLRTKPPSSSVPLEEEGVGQPFRFGTLSSLVNHRVRGAYVDLPQWADQDSASSLRDPPENIKVESSTTFNHKSSEDWNTKSKISNFYGEDDDDDSDDDDDDDDSDDDSDSSEESSEEDSDDDDDSESEDSDDEDSDDDDDDSDDDDDDDDDLLLNTNATRMQPAMNGGHDIFSKPLAQTADPIVVEDVDEDSDSEEEIDDDDDDDDDEDDDDDDDDDDDEVATGTNGSLLDFGVETTKKVEPKSLLPEFTPAKESAKKQTNGQGYAEGLTGLVMAPIVVDAEESTHPNLETDGGEWIDIVRHELAGGLSVKMRYIRGPSKDREGQLMGLDPSKPATVVVQLRFENQRTDRGILRRVRVVQRTSPSGSIGARRVVVPPEIVALEKSKLAQAYMGVDFASASDRDGAMHARFEIKSDRNSTPIDFKPPLCEVLRPIKMKVDAFDASMKKLHGFQRVASSFALPSSQEVLSSLPRVLLKNSSLMGVDRNGEWNEKQYRLVGGLPASAEVVFVMLQQEGNGKGKLIVCCDNALATNSILETLKKALKAKVQQ